MPRKCHNCDTITALYATEYVERVADSGKTFLKKRIKEVEHCPFCGTELLNA